ncbi:LPS assembly lipoprotein LptE [uncultured Helicobacter sp.]|uniref:LPS assembly lipoprotein LptE n=1 Tax=uncultured Helicobacter sp. TaxID=175537 RepID=UPI00262FD6A3|nr:LPS assembly lipoprotein LptE [uncultured Helicobacter sp.]
MTNLLKNTFCIMIFIMLSACGYQPIAHKAQEAVGDKVFVEVKINPRDPQNSIALKDEITRVIFERLHTNVSSKEEATSMIEVQLHSISFNALAENRTGFATFYRCVASVEFRYTNLLTQTTRVFSKRGYHNFALNNTSIITDSVRLEAINKAVLQAIDGFISQVGIDVQ